MGALKTAIQPGDEPYAFNSSMASWQARAGRQGIALVRAGKVLTEIITKLN
jgi:hypothetical protein